ncbi:MAG: septal ring lytic transglycosylase RlpA family protein [Sphingomonadales bacterium]
MKNFRILTLIVLASFVAACGTTGRYQEPTPVPQQPGDEKVKIGNPYEIGGITYYPRADPYYDVTGLASWYGKDFHGKATANGEKFDMNSLTAAHKTLPMPSYVRVTNLSNGRSLVLRVNDRGPFVQSRILDVSRRAAQLLGFETKGIERVRVQVVNADGTPIKRPVDGGLTPVPQRTADNELEAAPLENLPPPIGSNGSSGIPIEEAFTIFVQVASFSSEDNAKNFASSIDDIGPTVVSRAQVNNSWFYRVRLGAFKTMDEALRKLAEVKNLGFSDAHIFTQPGR